MFFLLATCSCFCPMMVWVLLLLLSFSRGCDINRPRRRSVPYSPDYGYMWQIIHPGCLLCLLTDDKFEEEGSKGMFTL